MPPKPITPDENETIEKPKSKHVRSAAQAEAFRKAQSKRHERLRLLNEGKGEDNYNEKVVEQVPEAKAAEEPDEPEIQVDVKKPAAPKKKSRVKVVYDDTDSDSSSEDERIILIKKKKKSKSKKILKAKYASSSSSADSSDSEDKVKRGKGRPPKASNLPKAVDELA